jgi:hypothetical protein
VSSVSISVVDPHVNCRTLLLLTYAARMVQTIPAPERTSAIQEAVANYSLFLQPPAVMWYSPGVGREPSQPADASQSQARAAGARRNFHSPPHPGLLSKGERIMFKRTTLTLTALACCLTLPALNAGTDMGCLPPPPPIQDYLKKTVRVDIKGQLVHLVSDCRGPQDPKFPMPNIWFFDAWQIPVGGKTYTLQFGERKDVAELANKFVGKTVIVSGTLDQTTVHVTSLKADDEYVKETTEVEARRQLQFLYTLFPNIGTNRIEKDLAGVNIVVDGKTYKHDLTPELLRLAQTPDGKVVVLSGILNKDTIAVKTLKAAK